MPTMNRTIIRDDKDLEVEVEYSAEPYRPQTRGGPAEGGAIEIESVTADNTRLVLTDAEEVDLIDWIAAHHDDNE